MIQSFFIVGESGVVLIEKHWRGSTSRSICDLFWEEVGRYPRKEDVPPIISTPKYYIFSVYRFGQFFVGIVTSEVSPLLVFELLHRIVDTFVDYFRVLSDEKVRDNFSTIYQLLDEMIDFGHPLTTLPNALKEMISPPTFGSKILSSLTGSPTAVKGPKQAVSAVPWRRRVPMYTHNEILFDITEQLDCTVAPNGQPLNCDVYGQMLCTAHLSGMPDVSVVFQNASVFDDVALHPCVRIQKFDKEKVMSFLPPDGQFELCTYRLKGKPKIHPPLYCKPTLTYSKEGKLKVHIMVGLKPMSGMVLTGKAKPGVVREPSVEGVKVIIPFPPSMKASDLRSAFGKVSVCEKTKLCTWDIGRIPKDRSISLEGSADMEGGVPEENVTVRLHFAVPGSSMSGIRVADIHVKGPNLKFGRGARHLTLSGCYEIRT